MIAALGTVGEVKVFLLVYLLVYLGIVITFLKRQEGLLFWGLFPPKRHYFNLLSFFHL